MKPVAKMFDGRSHCVGELPTWAIRSSHLGAAAPDMAMAPFRTCATNAIVVSGLP